MANKFSIEWVNFFSRSLLGFTPNKGQIATDDKRVAKEVIFYTRNKNLTTYITERGISYVIRSGDNFARIDYELIGARIERSKVKYYGSIPGYENYYLAHSPEGILFVKSYKKVVIKDIYDNIDWIFRYDEFGNFHHEFKIKKGGNVDSIRIRIKNAEVDIRDKEIEMKTPIGSIIDGKLVAYKDGEELEVSYEFEDEEIGFAISGYNGKGNLVIDPQLLWATYYGGDEKESNPHVSVDNNNNVYVVGYTQSTNFPTYNPGGNEYFQGNNAGNKDAFILKFNSKGDIQWATYYGGSGNDEATSISIDSNNNVYVVGHTSSTDFPVYDPGGGAYFQAKNAGSIDAFILKFDQNGRRLWATYYGGRGKDYATCISIDEKSVCANRAIDPCKVEIERCITLYIVGYTDSTDFPVYNPGGGAYFQAKNAGSIDAFILKFDQNGRRLWATYYGGSGKDYATSVSVDEVGECEFYYLGLCSEKKHSVSGLVNVYIVGYTTSDNFPVFNPKGGAHFQGKKSRDCPFCHDAFILKFNNNGMRLWATYLGGDGDDIATSVCIDSSSNVYVVGYTSSNNFPVSNPGGDTYFRSIKASIRIFRINMYDAFIVKFSCTGAKLWATYYGGRDNDMATSVFVDKKNNVYVVGYTFSDDFPVYNSYQGKYAGEKDAFILKFDREGVRLWATYYGGSRSDEATSIAIDKNNNIYVVGYTSSENFPVLNLGGNAYFQGRKSGDDDVFIIKFEDN